MSESKSNRPDWDNYFMGFADAASRRATCDRKHVGAVIVHVFYDETRTLYALEKLWGDAPVETVI